MDGIVAAAVETRREWVRVYLPRLLEERREWRRAAMRRELVGRLKVGFEEAGGWKGGCRGGGGGR
jgi:hypothetical protein